MQSRLVTLLTSPSLRLGVANGLVTSCTGSFNGHALGLTASCATMFCLWAERFSHLHDVFGCLGAYCGLDSLSLLLQLGS